VIAFTKSDLLTGPRARRPRGRQVEEKLQFVRFAPVLFLSAVTRQGIGRLLPTVRRVHRACGTRLPTAALNRLLEEAVAAHAPPTHRGRAVRFYYITQPQTHPPTFVISTSYPEGVHVTYQRFLANRLRERIGFEGTPIRLFFRQRGKER
jgi:GTP-binding protein